MGRGVSIRRGFARIVLARAVHPARAGAARPRGSPLHIVGALCVDTAAAACSGPGSLRSPAPAPPHAAGAFSLILLPASRSRFAARRTRMENLRSGLGEGG